MNVENRKREQVTPVDGALKYVANGEIGIITGQFRGNAAKFHFPWLLKVVFSSQLGYVYDYGEWDFSDEGRARLELAYSITVHKAQGSEFGVTILILPEPCRILSRELLYTALTRQKHRVVLLYQGDPAGLLRYTSDVYSETARRLTNLFRPPSPVQVQRPEESPVFLEQFLIHRSAKGEPMRSKSEVLIADALFHRKIPYMYEKTLVGNDGLPKIPDFTIVDDDSGITYCWEHLGLPTDVGYMRRWDEKKEWYRANGILEQAEGEGDAGIIIVTRDGVDGSFDSKAVNALIEKTFV